MAAQDPLSRGEVLRGVLVEGGRPVRGIDVRIDRKAASGENPEEPLGVATTDARGASAGTTSLRAATSSRPR